MNFEYSGSITSKSKYKKRLYDFLGVDYFNNQVNISEKRCYSMKNLIHRDGTNQKRFGWEQQLQILSNNTGKNINGFWYFKDSYTYDYEEDGITLRSRDHYIVHMGNNIYEVNFNDGSYKSIIKTNTYKPPYIADLSNRNGAIGGSILDQKSWGVVRGNRLYILTGANYLVYGSWGNSYSKGSKWELRIVEDDEDTYIPTTTIGITHNDSTINVRTSMDEVNLLSRYRRNKLIGENSAEKLTYALDGTVVDGQTPVVELLQANGSWTRLVEDQAWTLAKDGTTITFFPNEIEAPLIEGQSNIRVTFMCLAHNMRAIPYCRFGIMFGYNEVEHIFISGNEYFPNMDWHSLIRDSSETTVDITEYEDLTYFGDLSYTYFGSPTTKITGYSLLEDNTLAVHKEYSPNEPSLYFRKSYLGNAIDTSGNVVYDNNNNAIQRVSYSIYSSSIGEGCISNDLCKNLCGDKLILSRNGLFGIMLNNNIKSDERYARERSSLINNKLLREENLEEATSIVFENRLYIAINDKVYVADARFTSQSINELNDTFSYEWWVWENIPVRVWFVLNNELWFGTKDGRLCKFIPETFEDVSYNTLQNGITLSSNKANNELADGGEIVPVVFNTAEISVGDEIILSDSCNCFENIFTSTEECASGENIISLTDYKLLRFFDGKEVYIGGIEESNKYVIEVKARAEQSNEDTGYVLTVPETFKGTFTNIYNKVTSTSIILLNGNYYFKGHTTNGIVDSNGNTVYFDSNGNEIYDPMRLYRYTNTGIVKKVIKKNVEAQWVTPIIDFGTNNYKKTVKSITLLFEPVKNGEITIGYKIIDTNKSDYSNEYTIEGVENYDLNKDFSFSNVSFSLDQYVNCYTKKLKIKNINFLQLYYSSKNNKNCIVYELDIIYEMARQQKGYS